jgi:hypothetical protein
MSKKIFTLRATVDMKIFSKYIAMVVRNAMEDFHCKHLSEAQMKELDQRQSFLPSATNKVTGH